MQLVKGPKATAWNERTLVSFWSVWDCICLNYTIWLCADRCALYHCLALALIYMYLYVVVVNGKSFFDRKVAHSTSIRTNLYTSTISFSFKRWITVWNFVRASNQNTEALGLMQQRYMRDSLCHEMQPANNMPVSYGAAGMPASAFIYRYMCVCVHKWWRWSSKIQTIETLCWTFWPGKPLVAGCYLFSI